MSKRLASSDTTGEKYARFARKSSLICKPWEVPTARTREDLALAMTAFFARVARLWSTTA
eukprot:12925142-Heterocapsa_arctica.AAC.1